MKAILDEMLAALSRGERVVLSSILASSGSVPRGAGAKMAVFAYGDRDDGIRLRKCSN